MNDALATKAEARLVRSYVGQEPYDAPNMAGGNFAHVYLTPNGRNIVQIGPGVTVWERESGREVFRGPRRSVLSPDERFVAWADGSIRQFRVVDLANPNRGVVLDGESSWKTEWAFSPDDSRLAIMNAESGFDIWDLAAAKIMQHGNPHAFNIEYSSDGLRLLCWDEYISLLDARTLKPLWTNLEVKAQRASFSRDGSQIAATFQKTVLVLDAATGKVLANCAPPGGDLNFIETRFSPNGQFILLFWHGKGSATERGLITVYATETGMGLGRFTTPIPPVHAAEWSPDGKRILAGCGDGAMRLLDFETGKVLQIFDGHTGAVRAVNFSADGKFAASCCDDNKVRLFNIVVP